MPTEVLKDPVLLPQPGGGGIGTALPPAEGGDERPPGGILGDPTRFGLWLFLATLSMLFVGFTSAYMVRRTSADWRRLAPPSLLWLNTAVLALSSVTLEVARRRLRGWDLPSSQRWAFLTGGLGLLFVAGQLGVWRLLAAQGLYLAQNPHNSFFYVLTGLHGLHLLGGLAWFGVVLGKLARMGYTPGEDGLRLFATYWHFLTLLWGYLLVLLFVM